MEFNTQWNTNTHGEYEHYEAEMMVHECNCIRHDEMTNTKLKDFLLLFHESNALS